MATTTGLIYASATSALSYAIGTIAFQEDELPDEVVIPLYSVTPEEIFKGEIPLFNVNFFNPDTEEYTTTFSKSVSVDSDLYMLETTNDWEGYAEGGAVKKKFGYRYTKIENQGDLLATYEDDEVRTLGIVPDNVSGTYRDASGATKSTAKLYKYDSGYFLVCHRRR